MRGFNCTGFEGNFRFVESEFGRAATRPPAHPQTLRRLNCALAGVYPSEEGMNVHDRRGHYTR